ncbi:aromatic amino acid aminotransferase, partial [Fusarium albosuccineum]
MFATTQPEGAPLEPSSYTNDLSESLLQTQNGAVHLLAKRWEHRYSAESLAQSPSPLKESARTLDSSKMIPLGTGRPAAQYYPWKSMVMDITSASTKLDLPGTPNLSLSCARGEEDFDLGAALDYGPPIGSPKLINFFKQHVKSFYAPQYRDWDVGLTCGTTAALEIVFRMFCNRGDWILAEIFTYAEMIAAAKTQGINVLGIEMDVQGPIPEDLDAKLQDWDEARGPKPFVLEFRPSVGTRVILEEYKMRLSTSYLSLDTSGRVLRLDSSSKILAPGLRFGWVTASAQIIDMYGSTAEISSVSPSGPSQVMVYKLLNHTWGHQGFASWLAYLSSQYRQRRDDLVAASGIFVWLRIDMFHHPCYGQAGLTDKIEQQSDIEDRLYKKAQEEGVLVAKGS